MVADDSADDCDDDDDEDEEEDADEEDDDDAEVVEDWVSAECSCSKDTGNGLSAGCGCEGTI